MMFSAERIQVLSAIMDIVPPEHPQWHKKNEIEWYVWRCMYFIKTKQDIHNVVNRWLAGKRKATPPGTRKAKELAKKKRKGLPQEAVEFIDAVLKENMPLVVNYKAGQEKALNVLVGKCLKVVKEAPALVKEHLVCKLTSDY